MNQTKYIEDPYELLVELEKPQNKVYLTMSEITIQDYNGIIINANLDHKVKNPYEILSSNKIVRENLRRGLTFIQHFDNDNQPDKLYVAKKGLRHTLSLNRERLELNLKLKKQRKHSDIHETDYDQMFNQLEQLISDGNTINLVALYKVDGIPFSVSYVQDVDAWLIGTDNVSFLARSKLDLQLNKQSKALNILIKNWFKFLESLSDSQIKLFQLDVTNRTLQGILQSDEKQEDLLFHSITDNDSFEAECHSIQQSQSFFANYGMKSVPFQVLGDFKTFYKLNVELHRYLNKIQQQSSIAEGQGVILFFQSQQPNSKKPPSCGFLSQIDSTDYLIFESIKDHLLTLAKDKKASPKETVNHFESIYNKVFSHLKPFNTKDYYLRVLDQGIDFVLDNYLDVSQLTKNFNEIKRTLAFYVENQEVQNGNPFKGNQQHYIQNWKSTKTSKKSIIACFPVGLSGMGKSTLFEAVLNNILKSYSNVNVQVIGFDKIKHHVMNIEKEKQKYVSHYDLIMRTEKEAVERYRKEIKNIVDSFEAQDRFEVLFLLLDRNHIMANLTAEIEKVRKLENHETNFYSVVLYPLSSKAVKEQDVKLPFSLNFAFNCICRVQQRKSHEVLAGDGIKSLEPLIKQIRDFTDEVFECPGADYEYSFPYIQENDKSDKQYGVIAIQDFFQLISKQNEQDGDVNGILEDFLEALQFDQPNLQKLDDIDLDQKAGSFVQDVLQGFQITPKQITKVQKEHKRHSVQFQDFQQIQLPEYIGLFIKIEDNKDIIEWIQDGLNEAISTAKPNTQEILSSVRERLGRYHLKEFHLTTYYVGKRDHKDVLSSKEYQQFKEGQEYDLILDHIVFIPDCILVVGVEHSKLPPIQDQYPLLTISFNKFKNFSPKDSQYLMKQTANVIDHKNLLAQRNIQLNGEHTAYMVVPKLTLKVKSVHKKHFQYRSEK